MTTHTIPAFTGRITGGLSETKQQSRVRNDVLSVPLYARRVDIDRLREDQRLQRELKEMEL